MSNIVLIGFMGCGKTTVGMQLASKLGYDFIDTDKLIVDKYERNISDIFIKEGEAYFRHLETKIIEELCVSTSNSIISVGGGLPITAGNGDILRRLGRVIFLTISKESVMLRLRNDRDRPLLAGDCPDKKVEELLRLRQPIYKAIAHDIITVDDKNVDCIVDEICKNL